MPYPIVVLKPVAMWRLEITSLIQNVMEVLETIIAVHSPWITRTVGLLTPCTVFLRESKQTTNTEVLQGFRYFGEYASRGSGGSGYDASGMLRNRVPHSSVGGGGRGTGGLGSAVRNCCVCCVNG